MTTEKGSILIVEDDLDLNESISFFLEVAGYSCTSVSTATDAIDLLLNKTEFDLVLCDVNLPDTLGYEVLRKLKEVSPDSDTVFIFLSAYTDKHYIDICMELGADEYITKPFTYKHLTDRITTLLSKA